MIETSLDASVEASPEAASPAMPAPRVGDQIGPYRLVGLLGAGTGGRVFEVLHEKVDRRAALKLLDAVGASLPATRSRFFAEALSINRINHPHIVEVTDIVEVGGHSGLVMELLEGQSLGAAVAAEGPLPPERFLPILAEVCEALAAAHEAGFVHRDLKPENVFLCDRHGSSDFVKLLDFGVAAPLTRTRSVPAASAARPDVGAGERRGPLVGTPAYVSPEQAAGGVVDHATDIYAVGVMLYELACGRLPFEGWTVGEFLIQHLSAPVPRLPAEICATPLGRALDAIVQGCMAKQPLDRFSSASELAVTFRALARGEIVSIVTATTPLRRPGRWTRARAVGAVAALVVAAATAAHVAFRAPSRATAQPPTVFASVDRAPAAPVVVTLVFESDPPGAEARLVADGALLGVTPFRRAFRRDGASVAVELVRDGYEPVRLTISIANGRTISARLAPVARAVRARRARPSSTRPLGSEKTIDPFRR